jgi:hypothetical protein
VEYYEQILIIINIDYNYEKILIIKKEYKQANEPN